jgi:suppressor for copper-sensitivity B
MDEREGEPVWLAVVVVLSTALALGFWGFLELPFGRRVAGTGWCLLAGLLAAALAAGWWPLPPFAEAVREAAPAGPFAVAAVLAAGGIGLAAPFLVLAVFPGRLRAVPAFLAPSLGFLAAGGVIWLLYRLSRGVVPSGLAWIELALLVVSLLAWARVRFVGRPARAVLALALLAATASVPWLAHQHRRVHSTFHEGANP